MGLDFQEEEVRQLRELGGLDEERFYEAFGVNNSLQHLENSRGLLSAL